MRLPLIKSFHRELERDIPSGSDGLNKDAVVAYVGDIFVKDAALSLRRAEVMAQVEAAGLVVDAVFGDVAGATFEPSLPEFAVVARKPAL